MKLSLWTPEKTLLDQEEVKEMIVPSVKGELGILPGHAPLISLLQAGVLKYWPKKSQKPESIALGWGYLEVRWDGVRILAESAETKETLDKAQTEKNLQKTLSELKNLGLEPAERQKLEKQKQILESQLQIK